MEKCRRRCALCVHAHHIIIMKPMEDSYHEEVNIHKLMNMRMKKKEKSSYSVLHTSELDKMEKQTNKLNAKLLFDDETIRTPFLAVASHRSAIS